MFHGNKILFRKENSKFILYNKRKQKLFLFFQNKNTTKTLGKRKMGKMLPRREIQESTFIRQVYIFYYN